MKKKKVLFIVKQRLLPHYGYSSSQTISSGLVNSATFVSEMLDHHRNIESKIVQVIDNNCIDREVTKFKPDFVMIEAVWVVPEKFIILAKLHPTVKWVIRVHSEVPFIANEGNLLKWLFEYVKLPNVFVSSNSIRVNNELTNVLKTNVILLPNFYPIGDVDYTFKQDREVIDISCFGAVRPFKNHLLQGMAAMKFADDTGKKLRFHINVNRIEGFGEPALKNVRALFEGRPDHELVEHLWANHTEFMDLVRSMDIAMQVSFTETFNIVAADAVVSGTPIVVSDEIYWANRLYKADPTSYKSMVCALKRVWLLRHLGAQRLNTQGLRNYNSWSEQHWVDYITGWSFLTEML